MTSWWKRMMNGIKSSISITTQQTTIVINDKKHECKKTPCPVCTEAKVMASEGIEMANRMVETAMSGVDKIMKRVDKIVEEEEK